MSNISLCPACQSDQLDSFYRLDNIPVHSCLLLESREKALEFPRDRLELAVCLNCGFISNTCFDTRWMAYAPEYEDQQAFSPTFNRFAHDLAGRLIDRYALHNKSILEIGCGKGDFLRLLCERGNNRGIGIDPSVNPARFRNTQDARIEWVPEYFHKRHAGFTADFICCRHSLEHIPAVGDFLQTLSAVIGERSIPVFFEVPDTTRVLTECAFEDIYYEHCSYFTRGSLNRLFRGHGFGIMDSYLAYDGQYLLLEAHSDKHQDDASSTVEDSVAETQARVEQFRSGISDKLRYWQRVIDRDPSQRVALWGSGSKCVSLLSSVEVDPATTCVVDINPHRQGKHIAGSGFEIQAPEYLSEFEPQQVIAMNRIYTDEIRDSLDRLGVSAILSAL